MGLWETALLGLSVSGRLLLYAIQFKRVPFEFHKEWKQPIEIFQKTLPALKASSNLR